MAARTAPHLRELRARDIDWLRWMAASVDDQDLLETLAQDPDTDVRITLVILKARTQMLVKRGVRCGLWSLS